VKIDPFSFSPMKKNGFTLIEMILVVALIFYMGFLAVLFYSNFYLKNAASNIAQDIVSSLRKAQTYSMAGRQGGSWGVAFTGGNIVLFKGSSYAARNSAFDEITSIPSTLAIAGFNETVFSRVTGFPNVTSMITITGGGFAKQVTVSSQGIVNVASIAANSTSSAAWYSASWPYREQITIDHTKVASSAGTEGYVNFPVLVNVTNTNLQASSSGGHVGNIDGSDILFAKSDGTTKVNHEIELYASSTGNLVAWVQMPTVSTSTDTIFYMYYGNAGVANQQNASGTWDANYKGVWHLANPTNPIDSTSNANNGTNNSTAATAGQIGGGADMASGHYISIPDSAGFHFGTGVFSFGMWVKIPVFGTYYSLGGNNVYSGGWSGISMNMDVLHSINGITPVVVGYSYPTTVPITDVNVTTNVWHYVVTTRDGSGTVFVYWDGVKSIYSFTNAGNVNSGNPLYLGRNFDANYPRGFGGSEDEVRLSNTNRSADWIKTEYNNQSSPGAFSSVGTEQIP
jgi:Tfp pilus assembly protein FimT